MPGHDSHVPIWANFVVYGPILKISNSIIAKVAPPARRVLFGSNKNFEKNKLLPGVLWIGEYQREQLRPEHASHVNLSI